MAKNYKNKLNTDIRFSLNSILKVPRTTFFRNQKNITTFNSGDLVPLFCDEVLPGDTYSLDLGSVVRFNSALIRPVMDDAKVNVWAFFVPKRLVESNWQSLIANYRDNPDWTTDVNLSMSSLTIPTGGFAVDSVADHFGVPVGQGAGEKIVHAPIRAYCLIWDNWFRDENLQQSITVNTSFADTLGVSNINGSYLTDAIKGGRMCPLNKIHDYFTSALPAPQEGSPSIIGIGATAPVYGTDQGLTVNARNSGGLVTAYTFGNHVGSSVGEVSRLYNYSTQPLSGSGLTGSQSTFGEAVPVNVMTKEYAKDNYLNSTIYADLSAATSISVNDLRYAVQVQMIKETDARYGNRYKEFLLGHFGVVSADARLQIPEYLGSATFNIDTQQVAQTSSTDSTTPQGSVAAYSLTNNVSHLFTKSFTEHGYVIVVGGVRVAHRTYSQGLNKIWTRFTRFDNYFPELSHIGEQPILNQEIYLQDKSVGGDENTQVFGYQEAWADYRYLPNQATGYMRPNVSGSLAVWNYADNYNSLPTLSGAWIQEDRANINRTLAISSTNTPMFLGDFYFKNKATRPMPLHSVPGLVDHSGKIII